MPQLKRFRVYLYREGMHPHDKRSIIIESTHDATSIIERLALEQAKGEETDERKDEKVSRVVRIDDTYTSTRIAEQLAIQGVALRLLATDAVAEWLDEAGISVESVSDEAADLWRYLNPESETADTFTLAGIARTLNE